MVSVIVPVFNGQEFLAEAMRSILRQSLDEFEVIAVDDASTDESVEVMRRLADGRVRVLALKENRGLAGVRNHALAEARGEFVAFLDCDDIMSGQRLERQWRFLRDHPEIGLVGSWTDVFGARQGPGCRFQGGAEDLSALLLFENPLTTSSVMVRREWLQGELGPFDERFPPAEDYHLWVRLARKTHLWIIPEVLVHYRIHGGQTSESLKGRVAEARRGIYREILKDLQLSPRDWELEIHDALSHGDLPGGVESYGVALGWLERLAEANTRQRRFERRIFAEVLRRKAVALGHRSRVGWRGWEDCNRMLARKVIGLPVWERGRHFISSSLCRRAARRESLPKV